jgi:hypothetical protein
MWTKKTHGMKELLKYAHACGQQKWKKKLHGGIRDAWIFKYVLINTYKLIKDEPKEYIYIEREREREREND